jgi:topoisomerase IA-like protein
LLEDGGSGVGGYVKKEEKEEKEEKEKKEGGNTNNKKWEYQGLPLSVKKGKFGLYAAWGKNTKSLRPLGNRPLENITYEEVVVLL